MSPQFVHQICTGTETQTVLAYLVWLATHDFPILCRALPKHVNLFSNLGFARWPSESSGSNFQPFYEVAGSFKSFASWETWHTSNAFLLKIVNFQWFSDALRHLHIRRWRFWVEHPFQQIINYVFKKWKPRWVGGGVLYFLTRGGDGFNSYLTQ